VKAVLSRLASSAHTTGEGRKKEAIVEVVYAFEPLFHAVENGTA
jgi:hypothetical protein